MEALDKTVVGPGTQEIEIPYFPSRQNNNNLLTHESAGSEDAIGFGS